MNFLIIANNKDYNPDITKIQQFYTPKDKIIRLGQIGKSKKCASIFKNRCDIHILRNSLNHFRPNGQTSYKTITSPHGIIGHNLSQWVLKKNRKITDFDPVIELNNIQELSGYKISSGFGVAHYYSNKYPKSTIYLIGFTFKGFTGHNWKYEKKWCQEKENIKIL